MAARASSSPHSAKSINITKSPAKTGDTAKTTTPPTTKTGDTAKTTTPPTTKTGDTAKTTTAVPAAKTPITFKADASIPFWMFWAHKDTKTTTAVPANHYSTKKEKYSPGFIGGFLLASVLIVVLIIVGVRALKTNKKDKGGIL